MIEPTDEPAREIARRREWHGTMLIVATAVVVLSVLLRVRDDQRVEFRFFPGCPAPEMCLSKFWFEHDCPGCGLTRSFIYLFQGDWRASLARHRIGWLFAVALLVQFPYRLIALRRPLATNAPAWASWFGWLLVVLVIGNWLLNLVYSTSYPP